MAEQPTSNVSAGNFLVMKRDLVALRHRHDCTPGKTQMEPNKSALEQVCSTSRIGAVSNHRMSPGLHVGTRAADVYPLERKTQNLYLPVQKTVCIFSKQRSKHQIGLPAVDNRETDDALATGKLLQGGKEAQQQDQVQKDMAKSGPTISGHDSAHIGAQRVPRVSDLIPCNLKFFIRRWLSSTALAGSSSRPLKMKPDGTVHST